MDNVILFLRERQGSGEFVSRLSVTHGTQLLRFLARMLGRKDVAEDIAQQTYLKLCRSGRIGDVHCPRALLFDVATKLAIDQLRRQRFADASKAFDPADINDVPDESPQPDVRAMLDQAMQRLTGIIDTLQPSLREVFVMRYVVQMPRQEIAERLHISVGAIEQRLTRALKQCREGLVAQGIDWVGLE